MPLLTPTSAVVIALLAGAACAPSAAAAGFFSSADQASLAKLQRRLGGRIGVAIVADGRGGTPEQLGSLRTGVAWSTSKTAVAMAVVAAGGGSRQAADLRRAITASDNAAAEALWASLGSPTTAAAAADRQLRAAGDAMTVFESRRLRPGFTAFGQTRWSLADQARFTAGMRCTPAGRKVLGLMGQIVPSERWGLGSVGRGARFKGGWGPGVGGGYLDRQMGTLRLGGRSVAVTIASLPADGSHATGTRNLSAIATWVTRHADTRDAPASPSC